MKTLSNLVRGIVLGAFVAVGFLTVSCNNGNTTKGNVNKDVVAQIGFYETYDWNALVDAFVNLSKEAVKHNDSPDAFTLEQMLGQRDKSAVFSRLDDGNPGPTVGSALVEDTAAVNAIIAKYGPEFLPKDLKLAWSFKPFKPSPEYKGPECYELIALKTTDGKPYMTGESIVSAEKELTPDGYSCIMLTFDEKGKQQLAQLTATNVGHHIADVINGKVYSYPKVMCEVPGGKIQVVGQFSEEDIDTLIGQIYEKE